MGKDVSMYYLMHKNIPVAIIDVDKLGGVSNFRVINEFRDFLPLGAEMNNMKFYDWWKDRAVPRSRQNAGTALRKLRYTSTQSMLVDNLALSLTDCYWIKPYNTDVRWEDVNLFTNDFVDIFGSLTFDTKKNLDMRGVTEFRCASSQGELQKKWCIDKANKRFMVKGNWGSNYQPSLNEVFATLLHKKQGIQFYTPYDLIQIDVEGGRRGIGCYSYNFCSEGVEFVSAWELLNTVKLRQNTSWFDLFKKLCIERLGFSSEYFHTFLDYEIITDFIVSNTDRHMNNIGVLRDSDTLQYIGFAPIYDTGGSMFFKQSSLDSVRLTKLETCSFLKHEIQLLKYVVNRNIVDLNKLPNKYEFYEIYSMDVQDRLGRLDKLYDLYRHKVEMIYAFQSGRDIWKNKYGL